jgi:hypothetical protein
MMSYLLLCEIEATEKDKKMPQSLSVFAVSLQEHPELLEHIMHLSALNVKSYYFLFRYFQTRRRLRLKVVRLKQAQ